MIRDSLESKKILYRALKEGLGEDLFQKIDPEIEKSIRIPITPFSLYIPWLLNDTRVKVDKNIRYAQGAGRRHCLDVYRSLSEFTMAPVLLQIHGGGWVTGNKRQQARPLLNYMAVRGWVCVSINYRLSPKNRFPEHLIDVKMALRWIKMNISDYGGNPNYILVTGGSAGGHLASMAALTPNDPMYQPGFEDVDTTMQGCISFYGVYDFQNRYRQVQYPYFRAFFRRYILPKSSKGDGDTKALEQASPQSHVGPHAPPFFVIHGKNDSMVSIVYTRIFVEALRSRSTEKVLYAELPGAQHAFDVLPSIRTLYTVRAVYLFASEIYIRHQNS